MFQGTEEYTRVLNGILEYIKVLQGTKDLDPEQAPKDSSYLLFSFEAAYLMWVGS